MVLPIGSAFGMDIDNKIGPLLEYTNPGDILGSLFCYLTDMILVNTTGSLLGNSVIISPRALI